jgi:hypothetical protein
MFKLNSKQKLAIAGSSDKSRQSLRTLALDRLRIYTAASDSPREKY